MGDDPIATVPDYCFIDTPPAYRLSSFERYTLVGGAELERSLIWLAKKFDQFEYLERFGDFPIGELTKAASFYGGLAREECYVAPTAVPDSRIYHIHGLGDGNIVDIVFPSQYKVQWSEVAERYDSYDSNQKVYARMWKHDHQAPATIVAIHGWTMGDQRLNALAFQPGFFYRLGFDVLLVELPFHGRRSVRTGSGRGIAKDLFPSSDFGVTNEAIFQSIYDLRQVHLFLRDFGAENIGLMGMSLGAYLGGLWSSLDKLAFCISLVPVASMSQLAHDVLVTRGSVEQLEKDGYSRDLLDQLFKIHSPMSYQVRVPKDRLFIVAGEGDRVVPADQPKLLWQHWGEPEMYWFRGGHFAHFKKSRAFRKMVEFFKSLGYFVGG